MLVEKKYKRCTSTKRRINKYKYNLNLDNIPKFVIIILVLANGGVSEWFKELVLKTNDVARHRGFESYLLRHTCMSTSIF